MYLLDTCMISEARRATPEAVAWLRAADPNALYLSVISIGEIMQGVSLRARADARAAVSLGRWLDDLRGHYADRVLPIDDAVAMAWGQLMARRSRPVADGLIAATASVHRKILVTRNVDNFADTGIEIINPWT